MISPTAYYQWQQHWAEDYHLTRHESSDKLSRCAENGRVLRTWFQVHGHLDIIIQDGWVSNTSLWLTSNHRSSLNLRDHFFYGQFLLLLFCSVSASLLSWLLKNFFSISETIWYWGRGGGRGRWGWRVGGVETDAAKVTGLTCASQFLVLHHRIWSVALNSLSHHQNRAQGDENPMVNQSTLFLLHVTHHSWQWL